MLIGRVAISTWDNYLSGEDLASIKLLEANSCKTTNYYTLEATGKWNGKLLFMLEELFLKKKLEQLIEKMQKTQHLQEIQQQD